MERSGPETTPVRVDHAAHRVRFVVKLHLSQPELLLPVQAGESVMVCPEDFEVNARQSAAGWEQINVVSHAFGANVTIQEKLACELAIGGFVIEMEDTLGAKKLAIQMQSIQLLDRLQPTGLASFEPLVKSVITGEVPLNPQILKPLNF